MDDSINIEVEGFLFDHFPADEHFKMRESCEKIFLEWHNNKVLEGRIDEFKNQEHLCECLACKEHLDELQNQQRINNYGKEI